MDKELHLIQADLSEVEAEIESMVHILNALDDIYDHDGEKVAQNCVQVFRGWAKNLENEVSKVCDKLERHEL